MMFKGLRKRVGRLIAGGDATRKAVIGGNRPVSNENPDGSTGGDTLRRWEAAETNRLNKAHWQKAVRGQTINADLNERLEDLRTRSEFELANNPLLEGVVKTFCDDVVGENGPSLQAISGDPNYNRSLERVVAAVFEKIDAAGQMSMADGLRLNLRSCWSGGEWLEQIVTDPDEPFPVKLKLKALQTRRLGTPSEHASDENVTLGVRRNRLGRAIGYFLAEYQILGVFEAITGRYSEIPARDIIHEFLVLEAGQVRGVPWLATSLQSTADLRDYDNQVMDAARQAADWAIALYTDHVDAEYVELNETADVERRQFQTLPPGYKPFALQPPQPATNYIDYRAEKQRDVGRPAGMPLMTVRLDSSKHNYSSARFDAQVYRRGVSVVRGWIKRRKLNRLVEQIARESELFARANPSWEHAVLAHRPAGGVTYVWTWQGFPHVDDEKEANGQRMRMEDGTLTFSQACQENGLDPDAQIAQLEQDGQRLESVGITPPWKRQSYSAPIEDDDDDELIDAGDEEDESDDEENDDVTDDDSGDDDEPRSRAEGKWVTINGAPVMVNGDGTITKGPASMEGKKASSLKAGGKSALKVGAKAKIDRWSNDKKTGFGPNGGTIKKISGKNVVVTGKGPDGKPRDFKVPKSWVTAS